MLVVLAINLSIYRINALMFVVHKLRLSFHYHPYFSFPDRAKRKVIPPPSGQAPETPLESPL
jgi:hypothetical protein